LLLRPFAAGHLPLVRPWFDDIETRRWLGGPDWPEETLRLCGPSSDAFVAIWQDVPVGLIDCESYPDRRASFALVTAPHLRGRGLGGAMITALLAAPRYDEIDEFFVGIETGNVASERLMCAAGFALVADTDDEGFCYFAWHRHGSPTQPWVKP
jgi:RimJ/RimL family protein N-acetyltransferase